jgi:hypothetical protein
MLVLVNLDEIPGIYEPVLFPGGNGVEKSIGSQPRPKPTVDGCIEIALLPPDRDDLLLLKPPREGGLRIAWLVVAKIAGAPSPIQAGMIASSLTPGPRQPPFGFVLQVLQRRGKVLAKCSAALINQPKHACNFRI